MSGVHGKVSSTLKVMFEKDLDTMITMAAASAAHEAQHPLLTQQNIAPATTAITCSDWQLYSTLAMSISLSGNESIEIGISQFFLWRLGLYEFAFIFLMNKGTENKIYTQSSSLLILPLYS